jgi:hypothetical protein
MALQESIDDIVPSSAAALRKYAGALPDGQKMPTAENVWKLSGVSQLFDAISRRGGEGEGAEMMTTIRKRAINHLHGIKASSSIVSLRLGDDALKMIDPETLGKHLDEVEERFHKTLNTQIDKHIVSYATRIDQSHKRFLDRALESLLRHLETKGEDEVWQYSPDGLRILLRSSYQSMRKAVAGTCENVFAEAANEFTHTYKNLLSAEVEGFVVMPPSVPEFPPPVTLGQTIALDLQSSWWKGWWKRRKGYRAYADGFYKLIEEETQPIVNDMKVGQANDVRRIALHELDQFMAEQSGILTGVSNKSQISEEELKGLFGITLQEERDELFDILFTELAIGIDAEPAPKETEVVRPTRPAPAAKPLRSVQDERDSA